MSLTATERRNKLQEGYNRFIKFEETWRSFADKETNVDGLRPYMRYIPNPRDNGYRIKIKDLPNVTYVCYLFGTFVMLDEDTEEKILIDHPCTFWEYFTWPHEEWN